MFKNEIPESMIDSINHIIEGETKKPMAVEDTAAFIAAASAASAEGKKKFMFGDKEYPVTISKKVADKISKAMKKEETEIVEGIEEIIKSVVGGMEKGIEGDKEILKAAAVAMGEMFGRPTTKGYLKDKKLMKAILVGYKTQKEEAEVIDEAAPLTTYVPVTKKTVKDVLDVAKIHGLKADDKTRNQVMVTGDRKDIHAFMNDIGITDKEIARKWAPVLRKESVCEADLLVIENKKSDDLSIAIAKAVAKSPSAEKNLVESLLEAWIEANPKSYQKAAPMLKNILEGLEMTVEVD